MRIGAFSRLAGVSASKVRFYETRGLLPRPERSANGYRSYSASDLQTIRFVDAAVRMGFSLSEVALFMSRPASERHAKAGVIPALRGKLAEADRLMARLAERRRLIVDMLSELASK